jgi:hypothetical protein
MSVQNRPCVGLDAPQFIESFVTANPTISSIKLFRPKYFPPLQEAPTLSHIDHQIIEEGLKIRHQLGLSFWDSLLLHVSTQGAMTENILKLATRHNPQDLDCIIVPRAECKELNFRNLIAELTSEKILAVSSSVITDNRLVRHFPMIDFHCRESDGNLTIVKTVIRELDLKGFIAKSGGSYHFYGHALVDGQDLISILGRALLFSPIVDHRWIAHQLLERACGLRISPGKQYATCPEIIAEV